MAPLGEVQRDQPGFLIVGVATIAVVLIGFPDLEPATTTTGGGPLGPGYTCKVSPARTNPVNYLWEDGTCADFGAGYTSFSYLRDLPSDLLKIDGSFIVHMNQHPANVAIVEAIVGLARNLGMKTIAEFAATPEIVDMLRQMGVDYAQGYAIGAPKPFPGVSATPAVAQAAAANAQSSAHLLSLNPPQFKAA